MEKYIGVKMVDAAPAVHNDQPGFSVLYDTGYESWSPAEPFERGYQSVQAMSFGVAFEALRMGLRVRRPNWDAESFLFIDYRQDRLPLRMLLLHVIWSGSSVTYHWVPSEIDALACDWQLIPPPYQNQPQTS